jgi:hypothetical protein
MEITFNTIAYIFKYINKNIIKDLTFWFEKYIPLLSDNKWYIREVK